MMKFPILILFVVIHCSLLAQNQGKWIVYGKEAPTEKIASSPPLNGYQIHYRYDVDSTGIIDSIKKEEGHYLNDRKEGPWINYFDDGITPKLISNYVNNRPYGDNMKFYPSSQLRETGCFIKNCLRDSIIRYHQNGNRECATWYNEKGKEDGAVKLYYENGQLEFTYFAKDGIPVDTAYRYYNNGDLKEAIIYGMEGMITNTIPYEAVNPLIPETLKPEPSKPVIPQKPGFMDENNKPNGYHKIYNDKGEIWMDGIFAEGVLQDGKVYDYDESGILLKVRVYKSGQFRVEKK